MVGVEQGPRSGCWNKPELSLQLELAGLGRLLAAGQKPRLLPALNSSVCPASRSLLQDSIHRLRNPLQASQANFSVSLRLDGFASPASCLGEALNG